MAVYISKNAPQETNVNSSWTYVNDGLPDTGRDVLVTDGFDICVGYYNGPNTYVRGWRVYDERVERSSVIAWMELPKYPTYDDYMEYMNAKEEQK